MLDGPAAVDSQAWAIEDSLPGGEQLAPGPGVAVLSAQLLAQLTALTPVTGPLKDLRGCSPPWVGWDHPGVWLWSERDTFRVRLNDHDGPGWIDQAPPAPAPC